MTKRRSSSQSFGIMFFITISNQPCSMADNWAHAALVAHNPRSQVHLWRVPNGGSCGSFVAIDYACAPMFVGDLQRDVLGANTVRNVLDNLRLILGWADTLPRAVANNVTSEMGLALLILPVRVDLRRALAVWTLLVVSPAAAEAGQMGRVRDPLGRAARFGGPPMRCLDAERRGPQSANVSRAHHGEGAFDD